jgi:hypothetical protein
MSKSALEEELAAGEEAHLVSEFRRNLQYNLGKVGQYNLSAGSCLGELASFTT